MPEFGTFLYQFAVVTIATINLWYNGLLMASLITLITDYTNFPQISQSIRNILHCSEDT